MIRDTEILALARRLATMGGEDEAARRAAVSRAYYAAYHRCLALATERGYRFSRGQGRGSHAALLEFLKQSSDPQLKRLGRSLGAMRDWRTEVDYSLRAAVPPRRAQDAIERAERILATIPDRT